MGENSLLHHAAGDLRDLYADALSGDCRRNATVLTIYGGGVPAEAHADSPGHDLRGNYHDCGAVYFCDQSVLEHVQGAEGPRQSVGVNDAGVDDGDSAAA